MAAKIQSKYTIQASGILRISGSDVFVENNDTGDIISLSELFVDFTDKEVKLSIAYGEELS
ncbi:MAG: hypothetical protein PUE12_18405 [Oscillospiraceae bacterium]|nr:hypothetical protein [Oscillospiraceae bacterium]